MISLETDQFNVNFNAGHSDDGAVHIALHVACNPELAEFMLREAWRVVDFDVSAIPDLAEREKLGRFLASVRAALSEATARARRARFGVVE